MPAVPKPNKKNKKGEIRKKDAEFRIEIIARDRICQRCGKGATQGQLQCAHIYSRRYKSIRWDMDNALTLCAGCHFYVHQNPVEFAFWFERKYPDRLARLQEKKKLIGGGKNAY